MPKLTLWMQMSLDGYAEGPDHAFDWPVVGPKLQRSFIDELRHADAFVYGRRIYQMMASVWPTMETHPDAPPEAVEFARIWLPMPKFVFSQTLRDAGLEHDCRPRGRGLERPGPRGAQSPRRRRLRGADVCRDADASPAR